MDKRVLLAFCPALAKPVKDCTLGSNKGGWFIMQTDTPNATFQKLSREPLGTTTLNGFTISGFMLTDVDEAERINAESYSLLTNAEYASLAGGLT